MIRSIFFIFVLLILPMELRASQPSTVQAKDIGIDEHLGGNLSMDTVFTDENGKRAPLKDMVDTTKPTIVALVYYECPNLCTLLLNGLTSALKELDWNTGEKFNVVAISINPSDTPELAQAKK